MGFDIGDALTLGLGGPGAWFVKQGVESAGGAAREAVKDTSHDAGSEFGKGLLDGIEAGVKQRMSGAIDGVRHLVHDIFHREPHAKHAAMQSWSKP